MAKSPTPGPAHGEHGIRRLDLKPNDALPGVEGDRETVLLVRGECRLPFGRLDRDDDIPQIALVFRILGRIGLPWYNVPGNHEMNLLATEDR